MTRKHQSTETSLDAFYSKLADGSLQKMELEVMDPFLDNQNLLITRQDLVVITGLPINCICGRIKSLLMKGVLSVCGEEAPKTKGAKYRELLGLPRVQMGLFI